MKKSILFIIVLFTDSFAVSQGIDFSITKSGSSYRIAKTTTMEDGSQNVSTSADNVIVLYKYLP